MTFFGTLFDNTLQEQILVGKEYKARYRLSDLLDPDFKFARDGSTASGNVNRAGDLSTLKKIRDGSGYYDQVGE